MINDEDNKKEAPQKYKDLQKEWRLYEFVWSTVHYTIGLFATILAFLASTKDLGGLVTDPNIITASVHALYSGSEPIIVN